MIKFLTNYVTGVDQPDGTSIATARGFTDNGTTSATVAMGYMWDPDTSEETSLNDQYFACSLVGGVTYDITNVTTTAWFDDVSAPYAQFQDSNGTNVGTQFHYEMDYDTWEMVSQQGSFTPSTSGIYYLHVYYSGDWGDVTASLSVAPQEYSLGVKHYAPVAQQVDKVGKVKKVLSATNDITPALFIPLLTSADASLNPTNATVTVNGSLTFNGDCTTFTTNNNNVEIKAPNIFNGSFTFGVDFYPTSTADWYELMFLYGDDARPRSDMNSRIILVICSHTDSNKHMMWVYMYDDPVKCPICNAPKKPTLNTWHKVYVAYDRNEQVVRAAYDGLIYGERHLGQWECGDNNGLCPNGGGTIRLGGINGDRGFWGNMKNFKLFNYAFSTQDLMTITATN